MKRNMQYIVMFHHFRRFLEVAAAERIDAAPLKGAHLLTSVYPEGEDRGTLSDVDFLVRPEDFPRAVALLTRMGFRPRESGLVSDDSHEQSLSLDIGDGRRIMFEVHRSLFDPKRLPIDHAGVWARSLESTFDGVPCRRLSPEDNFVHIAAHAAIHRLMMLSRAVRDLEMLARHGDLSMPVVVERAREWRFTRAVWLFMALLGEDCADLHLDPFAVELAPPRSIQSALRGLVPDSSRTRLSDLHHRIQAALLWPWIFDHPKQLLRFVWRHPDLFSMVRL